LGVSSVNRLLAVRRQKRVRLEDVRRLCKAIGKVKPFIVAEDWTPGALTDSADLKARLTPGAKAEPRQLSLF
jgi:predicted DNA-binding helix-hairpin-helix protein